ncbi:hypothetical protein ACOI1C_21910 [Bacillus sp. DJP31]|uniref:hypothetical protein n=1 Tax=Bacillus sp. DJP31 TaxID=3409789 RepID=UPI003BB5857E
MKKVVKILLCLAFSYALVLSGTIVSPTQKNVTASDANAYGKNAREIVFYGEENEHEEVLKKILKETVDQSSFGIQRGLNKEKVKIKVKNINDSLNINLKENVHTVAFPYDTVLTNRKIKEAAIDALDQGIKVYLYDSEGFSLGDYKQILEVENFVSMDTDFNGKDFAMSIYENEFVDKENDADNYTEPGVVYHVIGYTQSHEETSQFSVEGYTTGTNDEVAIVADIDLMKSILSQEIASYNTNNGLETWQEENEVAEELNANAFETSEASAVPYDSNTSACTGIFPSLPPTTRETSLGSESSSFTRYPKALELIPKIRAASLIVELI